MVDIAQLVSASDCGSEGRGFESHYPPHKKKRYHPVSLLFIWADMGFERSLQMSGGHLLATGLDGGNTLIFAKGENANESLIHPFI